MEPKPREPHLVNCVVIALYGSCFLFFLAPWMNGETPRFAFKISVLFLVCAGTHFLLLYQRLAFYEVFCRILRRRVRFFEFPYFAILSLFYSFVILIAPFLVGLIPLSNGLPEVIRNEHMTQYILFGGGAALVTAAISGFDIYPVNLFQTKECLEHLIGITRDLMKLSNRILVVVSGAILVGWGFQKIQFSPAIIYLTFYGVIGFCFGSTAVLGARVTELLYQLAALEQGTIPQARPRQ